MHKTLLKGCGGGVVPGVAAGEGWSGELMGVVPGGR